MTHWHASAVWQLNPKYTTGEHVAMNVAFKKKTGYRLVSKMDKGKKSNGKSSGSLVCKPSFSDGNHGENDQHACKHIDAQM
jgi:hypothetical protein